MTDSDFLQNFMKAFEERVLLPGLLSMRLGKIEDISVANGKLSKTVFGKTIGLVLPDAGDALVAVNYYGHLKKSLSFVKAAETTTARTIPCRVVHFASLRIEYIAKATDELELIAGFALFKEKILTIRGFKHSQP